MKNIPLILICIVVFFILKKKFFDTNDYQGMLEKGALILDVRSENEFLTGNIKNSINIPLQDIGSDSTLLSDRDQIIITCCASGMRSAVAKRILKSRGYPNVVNGGGWSSLNRKINVVQD